MLYCDTALQINIIPLPVTIAPTRVEFLLRVLLGIGALFQVGTPHSSISLHIMFRSCQGETQKHRSTWLPRITMSLQIISLQKLLYNIPTIHWTDKIYCSFALICWSKLFIDYQILSLIWQKERFISTQKSYQQNDQ